MGFDIEGIIKTAGYIGLFLIVFAETGLLIGFFLPGDTLLLSAGLLIQQDKVGLELWVLIPLLIAAAIIGDAVGYQVGKHTGPRIFKQEDSRLFHKDHLLRAQHFYDKHGGKTIILARFIPIVRTFAPFVAGMGRMTYRRFMAYNVVGGVAWILIFLVGGYLFGNLPVIKKNFTLVILGIIVVSILPGVIEFYRERRRLKRS